MAYPYAAPANDKTNATVTLDDHAPAHNALANALIDLLAELGASPKGAAASLTARLAALDTTIAAALDQTEGDARYVQLSALTESVQDLVGAMATDGATVNFTYDDTAGTLTAEVQGLTSANLSDFAEAVRDRVGSTLVAGTGITVSVDDPGDTVTIATTITQYTDEQARDAVGAALVAGNNIDITVNDGADTITIDVEALTSADLSDFSSAAQSAAVAQTITNGVTTSAPSQDAVFDALALKVAKAGDTMTGALGIGGSATVDTVDAWLAVHPTTNHAGIVIEIPDAAYGADPYTDGEFPFVVAEEGAGDLTDGTAAGSALFRIDGVGGTGQNGGAHFNTGVRKATGGTVAVWIDPAEDLAPLVIHNPTVAESAAWTNSFLSVVDTRAANAVRFAVNSVGQTVVDLGALGAPGIAFAGDLNTGVYSAAGDSFSLVAAGVAVATIVNPQLRVHAGTFNVPGLGIIGDANTGIYGIGADNLGISTGAVLRLDISTTAVTSTLPIMAPAGAVGAPAFSFAADPDTGIYNASNTILFSCGGTLRLTLDSGGLTLPNGENIIVGTGSGTKIGTATTSKIGFYNATPVVQGASVADATDAASAITQLNALISRIEALGLIATV